MADGYIESGEELLMFIKHTGLAEHDREAVDALEGIIKDLITTFKNQTGRNEKKLRRAYFTGFVHGIKMSADATKMHLRKARYDAGLDPDTGKELAVEG